MPDTAKSMRDVFISYASEDRESVAKPLAQVLTSLGVSVWFDEYDLKIGDSLRRKIDQGLSISRYGVVILSSAFFGKHYTNLELNGLAQREVDGDKVILPIWVGVDERQIRQYSPPLADRVAGRWEDGLSIVVAKLVAVIRPDIYKSLQEKPVHYLQRLRTGKEILAVITGSHFSYSHHDDPANDDEINLVGGFIQGLRDWADIWDDLLVPDQMKASLQITELVKTLEDAGWTVYAGKMKGKRESPR